MIWLYIIILIFSVLTLNFVYKDFKNNNFSKKSFKIVSIMESFVIIVILILIIMSLGKYGNVKDEDEGYNLVSELKRNELASTEILVKFDGIVYGKSYAIIDYAGGLESDKIGTIDKVIDNKYVPKFNNETNQNEILHAEVYNKTEDSIVLFYNNEYVLFGKISE